jgi:spore coat polysaccharide biosynthesis protein SpsF
LSSKRWTLDNPEDYRFVSAIYKGLYRKHHIFHMTEILDYLEKMPHLEQINSHITRNEGLTKSLKEDHKIN